MANDVKKYSVTVTMISGATHEVIVSTAFADVHTTMWTAIAGKALTLKSTAGVYINPQAIESFVVGGVL